MESTNVSISNAINFQILNSLFIFNCIPEQVLHRQPCLPWSAHPYAPTGYSVYPCPYPSALVAAKGLACLAPGCTCRSGVDPAVPEGKTIGLMCAKIG